jgi:hypothetical protein
MENDRMRDDYDHAEALESLAEQQDEWVYLNARDEPPASPYSWDY